MMDSLEVKLSRTGTNTRQNLRQSYESKTNSSFESKKASPQMKVKWLKQMLKDHGYDKQGIKTYARGSNRKVTFNDSGF